MAANREHIQRNYVGHPVTKAVQGLGYPEHELRLGDSKVFTWTADVSWGHCELRLEVNEGGIVVGESLKTNSDEACALLVKE
jgi:hypothetical protein